MGENKKIAKNSIILYIRLGITTLIGLYTSRIVLSVLGASDYGLYAVVGGIVIMMNFLNSTMLAVSFRYIAFEIGKGEDGNPNNIFNISLVIHLLLALVLIIFAEAIGVYYIHNFLNVESEKIPDAIFVLRFSVLAIVFSIISTPFQGVITANEKFYISATVSIIQSVLRLIVAFLLIHYLGNKLRYYAVLMMLVMIVPFVLYITYCQIKNRDIVKWKFNKNIADYLGMFKYSVWIMIGAVSSIGVRQGAALIINLFFGTAINAAFGIATQVYNYVMMFVKNLNQAAVPQITKSYSGGNSGRSLQLVYYISKYAFFLMLLPAIPILFSLNGILELWLVDVPEYTMQFILLMIINGLISCTGSGFDAAIQATGKIRKNQVFYSIITLSTLPFAYLCYKLRYPPYIITVLLIIATIAVLYIQIHILTRLTDFKAKHYFKHTINRVFFVSIIVIPQYFMRMLFSQKLSGILFFTVLSVILTMLSIYTVGLTNSEKTAINKLVRNVRNKI